jgi:hypothetical protein
MGTEISLRHILSFVICDKFYETNIVKTKSKMSIIISKIP